MERFSALLMSHLPAALYRQAKALFHECCQEVEKQHDEERKRKREADGGQDCNNEGKRQATARSPPATPKKDYEAEMMSLQVFKRENKGQKKAVFDKIKELSSLPRENTTKKARTWLTKLAQTTRCAEFCVANCHGGNWQSWEDAMRGEVPIGGYQKWKCNGCLERMNEIKNSE